MRAILALLVFALMSGSADSSRTAVLSESGSCLHLPDGSGCPLEQSGQMRPLRDGTGSRPARSCRISHAPGRDCRSRSSRGQPANLTFEIHDPWKDRPVTQVSDRPRKAVSHVCRQPGSGGFPAQSSDAGIRWEISITTTCSRNRACTGSWVTSIPTARRRS